MLLTIVEQGGNVGRIDEALTVTYTGDEEVAASIEVYSEDLQTRESPLTRRFYALLLELIGVYGIHEIRQWADELPESHPLSED